MVKKMEVDERLVNDIEHVFVEEFPNVNVNVHDLAKKAAEVTQEYRLGHINDSPGMCWIDDPEDDTEPT